MKMGVLILAKYNWMDITREDVIKAIDMFLCENPEYPEPKSTFLAYQGKKLPAKHIRGMAYTVHYGTEISKNDFGGGMETVRFFERLGFEMDYRGTADKLEMDGKVKKEEKSKPTMDETEIISEVPRKELHSDKIIIPSKQVIEQKNALQLILNRMFQGDIVCEKTFSWLKTPDILDEEYERLIGALSSYRGDSKFAKKNVQLRCDFVCESQKIIIEYDERQHFSEARKISLDSYRQTPLLYDRDLWIKACNDINAKDNSPVNRDEIRAYYDSTRDIESYRHGYKLIRIMHGQIDFSAEDAETKLEQLLFNKRLEECKTGEENIDNSLSIKAETARKPLKVGMYLQTNEHKNQKSFDEMLKRIKDIEFDILVFPEVCYVPTAISKHFYSKDILAEEDQKFAFDVCIGFSKNIGKAVVVSSEDKFGTLFSIFANANADESIGEEKAVLYIKHTMTSYSAFDIENYSDFAGPMFMPILFKEYKIGLSICYDCNHAIFSRIWGLQDVDIIINSTGGDVVFDKWYKYNKSRAIENKCFNLVTMGGTGNVNNPHCYVLGFNPNGGEMEFVDLTGNSETCNAPGEIYIYTVDDQKIEATPEYSLNQSETENKNVDFKIPVGNMKSILAKAKKIRKNIYNFKYGKENIIILIVEGMDILKSEIVLSLLYDEELKKYDNKKYIIYNSHKELQESIYNEKLSVVLKVRAMENFCAVVLESDTYNKCYQCGKNRSAQVVKEIDGYYGVDLSRTTGPEAIWRNKIGMRASWREGFEWLIKQAVCMS